LGKYALIFLVGNGSRHHLGPHLEGDGALEIRQKSTERVVSDAFGNQQRRNTPDYLSCLFPKEEQEISDSRKTRIGRNRSQVVFRGRKAS